MKDRDKLYNKDGQLFSFDNIRTQGWLDGHLSGLDYAARFLKDKALELFKAGKYEDSIALARLAVEMQNTLTPILNAQAQRHEREHPAEVGESDESSAREETHE